MYFSTQDTRPGIDTRLHFESVSAVHVVVYAQPVARWWVYAGIDWTVFRRKDVAAVCAYLQERQPHRKLDLGHLEQYSIIDSDLEVLAERGIKPVRFTLKQGQAVCISAGTIYLVNTSGLLDDTQN